MKKIVALILALTMLFTLSACGGATPSVAPSAGPTTSADSTGNNTVSSEEDWPEMTLMLSTYAAENNWSSVTSRMFIDKVEERTGGKITFDEYFDGTLANARNAADFLAGGSADCGDMVTIFSTKFALTGLMLSVPGGPSDMAQVNELLSKLRELHPEFKEEWEKNGVHPVTFKFMEPYILVGNGVSSLDDLNGVKVGCGTAQITSWLNEIGAVVVATLSSENYQNYKTNVISAGIHNPGTVADYKLYEVVDTVIDLGLCAASGTSAMVFNMDVWNGLPANVQELFTEIGQEVQEEYVDWMTDYYESNMQLFADKGLNVVKLSEEERQNWFDQILSSSQNNTIQQYIDSANAAGYDGAQIVSDYLTLGEEMGVVWPFDASVYMK